MEDKPFGFDLPPQKNFLCGLTSLEEGIKITGILYICAAFVYGYLMLRNLDKQNTAILFLVLLPRIILFVHTMRVETKVSRRSYYISNFICTGIWLAIFIVQNIDLLLSKAFLKSQTWVEFVVFFVLFIIQVYFAALSRSFWIDYTLHRAKPEYIEPRVDAEVNLH